MTVLLAERIERPASLFERPETQVRASAEAVARERAGDLSGGTTLDDAIVGAWEGLAARVVAACPVCSGALHPHTFPEAVGGCCGDCGTTLD